MVRWYINCEKLTTLNGTLIDWSEEIRYLGIHIVSSSKFKCSYADARKSFFRPFNAIYGRIARFADEEVTLSLIKFECIPVLLFGI